MLVIDFWKGTGHPWFRGGLSLWCSTRRSRQCKCICVREHLGRCMHMGVCMDVFVRDHVHRFTRIGMCMCLVLEAFEHGHGCVGKRERVVRCMHMGV